MGTSASNNGDFTGNNGGNDIVVFKLDNSLNLLWSKSIGDSENDEASTLLQDNYGNIIIGGRLKEFNPDIIFYKLDNNGNLILTKTYGGSGDDTGYGSGYENEYPYLYKNNNNEYFFTSITSSNNGDILQNYGGYDIWIIKIDSIGTLLWEKTLGGIYDDYRISNLIIHPNNEISFGVEVRDSSGNLIHPNFNSLGYGSDIGIIKLDSTGNTSEYYCFGGSEYENINNLIYDDNLNEMTFCGSSNSTDGNVVGNHGEYDVWVVKLNSTLSYSNLEPDPISKSLTKVFDLMGREIKPIPNQIFLHQFNDGSIEKKIIVEK